MSKFLYNLINNISFNNQSTPRKSSGSFSRDPKQVKAKRVGSQLGDTSGSGRDSFEGHDVNLSLIADVIRKDTFLTQGVMKYEELIFKSGWTLQSKNDQALEYIKFRLNMIAIATGIPTEEFFSHIARDIVWASNCFIVKARAKGGVGLPPGTSLQAVPPAKDPVVGYFVLPPQTIEIARDENGEITKYKQEVPGGGDAKEFNPEDIIHIKVNNRSGTAFGDPWIAPVVEDVRLLRKIEENVSLLLYKHIFPSLKYQIGLDKDGFQATDEEIDEARSMVDGMNEDSMYVIPERHNIEAIGIQTIDGNPYLEYFQKRVISGLGLSQVDFGRGDTANRNTADAMTGQKADRVKGWQKIIQTYIDKFIIEELLVEGGFDPLINPDTDVDFVFNEIELESKIKFETHELNKFNSNVQTWEETRVNIGQDSAADEERLHFNMIGNKGSEAASNTIDNQNQPENQNGKRSGPKKTTEFFERELETMHGTSESLSNRGFKEKLDDFTSYAESEINEQYDGLRTSILNNISESKRFPIQTLDKNLVSKIQEDEVSKVLIREAKNMFYTGSRAACIDTSHESNTDYNPFDRIVAEDIKSTTSRLFKSINEAIKENTQTENSKESVLAVASSAFESNQYKVRRNVKTLLARSYNYGYILELLRSGQKETSVLDQDECSVCKSKNKQAIKLNEFNSFDEFAIYYKIPPWHENCECEVTYYKGGET